MIILGEMVVDNARNKYNAYNRESTQSECLLILLLRVRLLGLVSILWWVGGILRCWCRRRNDSSRLPLLRCWLDNDLVNGGFEDLN
jgi:hypothetical protein